MSGADENDSIPDSVEEFGRNESVVQCKLLKAFRITVSTFAIPRG
jgi:hypothetical protein